MIHSGRLVVFEGPDAAGKSTICTLFCEWLLTHGEPAELLSFPGKRSGTLGELVYRIHHEPSKVGLETISATSLQALHVAAHMDAIESQILPMLQAGKTVVLDRFWWSTLVYGEVAGVDKSLLEKLIAAEEIAWFHRLPTALFCISRTTPLREEPAALWERWKKGYEFMVNNQSGRYPVFAISNDLIVDDCLAKIVKIYSTLL